MMNVQRCQAKSEWMLDTLGQLLDILRKLEFMSNWYSRQICRFDIVQMHNNYKQSLQTPTIKTNGAKSLKTQRIAKFFPFLPIIVNHLTRL